VSRRRKSPQEPEAVWPAAHPSIVSPPPAALLHHNRPEDQPQPPSRTSSRSPWSNQNPADLGIPLMSQPQRGSVLLAFPQ
jgi:hypothetical protein